MITQINRATLQLHDSYKINFENAEQLSKRINRLKTMKKQISGTKTIRKQNISKRKKAKFSKRKSIMQLFGDTRIN